MKNNGLSKIWANVRQFLSPVASALSKGFDTIVYSQKLSLAASLIAAVLICVAVRYDDISYNFFHTEATTLNVAGIPVEVKVDADLYEVSGLPSTVDLTVTGDPADIQVFRSSQSNVYVTADLRDFGEGENIVTFTVNNVSSSLDAAVTPSTAEVVLAAKKTKVFPVVPELLVGSQQKDSDFETPVLASRTVSITATQEQLDSIRVVKALVDVAGRSGDFETDAVVAAYDSQGNKVNVQIEPESIKAQVSSAAQKEESNDE